MHEFLELVHEMSPFLLLGFLLAGLMHAFIPGHIYSRYLSAPNLRSVMLAALFGIPLPLCSCGVLPTAMLLRREGASKGATVSFLIATPQTGVDSIIATFSLMGLPFALIRPLAALLTALFGGALVNAFDKNTPAEEGEASQVHTCCNGTKSKHQGNEEVHACCCNEAYGHSDTSAKEEHSCCCNKATPSAEARSFGSRLVLALRYGFVDMMQDIGKWLVIGLIAAGLITTFVPTSFFAIFEGNTLLSVLLVLLFAIPMYLCATGSIPIAAALMLKGLSPGAALVLLMAGPACNVASMLVVRKVLGNRTLGLYLLAIVGGALLFALGIDHLLPREWFAISFVPTANCCAPHTPLYQWISTTILLLLLGNAFLLRPLLHRFHH